MCTGLIFSAYVGYCLWYVSPDIIRFAGELCMAMEAALGSRADVLKALEMLEIIEWTRLQERLDSWRDRTICSNDYHPGSTGRIGDYIYYDPWRREEICRQMAWSRSNVTIVVADYIPLGWMNDDLNVER